MCVVRCVLWAYQRRLEHVLRCACWLCNTFCTLRACPCVCACCKLKSRQMIDGDFGMWKCWKKSSMIYAFLPSSLWLLNDCFPLMLRCCFFHYFALLMYFLTSHVHNSVSCKISYTRHTHTHKHTHTLQLWNFCCKVKVESLLSRFLVIFLLQPLPVCVYVFVFLFISCKANHLSKNAPKTLAVCCWQAKSYVNLY